MLETAFAQLRFAASLVLGIPFSTRSLDRLVGGLAIYDFIATWQLSLMTDLFSRLVGFPFAPLVAWRADSSGRWLGIGIGNLLIAAVFPLVIRKAFGRASGSAALTIGLGVIGAVLALPVLGVVHATFPVMIVLGPLIVLQYICWRHQRGAERTTWQYLHVEPHHERTTT